jgi:hypothetical protein
MTGGFRETRSLLETSGFEIVDERDDPASFGSWFLVVSSEPRVRIVWDGKDGWLIIPRQDGGDSWSDWWIGRDESEQSPEVAVSKVAECLQSRPTV